MAALRNPGSLRQQIDLTAIDRLRIAHLRSRGANRAGGNWARLEAVWQGFSWSARPATGRPQFTRWIAEASVLQVREQRGPNLKFLAATQFPGEQPGARCEWRPRHAFGTG